MDMDRALPCCRGIHVCHRPLHAANHSVASLGPLYFCPIPSHCVLTPPQAALLHRYWTATTEAEVPKSVLNFVVNQDPADPAYFQVIQRFPGPTGMVAHQSGAAYSAFVRAAQPLLAESLGVYLCKESGGKIGQALYPWGPKGEGGRDDMVVRLRPPVPRWGVGSWRACACPCLGRLCIMCRVCGEWLVSLSPARLTPSLCLLVCHCLVCWCLVVCSSLRPRSARLCGNSIGDDCALLLVHVPPFSVSCYFVVESLRQSASRTQATLSKNGFARLVPDGIPRCVAMATLAASHPTRAQPCGTVANIITLLVHPSECLRTENSLD